MNVFQAPIIERKDFDEQNLSLAFFFFIVYIDDNFINFSE